MGQPDPEEWPQIHERQPKGGEQRAPRLKGEYGKEILGQIVNDPERAVSPPNRD